MDELVGSLQTFEMSINERGDKKNKSIAFVTNTDDEESQTDCQKEESIADALMLIGRQFNKVLRHVVQTKWVEHHILHQQTTK
jgi:hypothetical protein